MTNWGKIYNTTLWGIGVINDIFWVLFITTTK